MPGLVPTGPQYGVKMTLIGPDGTVVTFNDSTDANNVGTITEVTGFDSPDVRENGDDLVGMDGGYHGDFFYGRRPITITGLIHDHVDTVDRNLRMTRLMQATNAMRADAVLQWMPDGAIQEQFVTLRRQQPLRITGGWNKQFAISLVAADPRIYSADLFSSSVNASDTAGATGAAWPWKFPLSFGAAVTNGQVFIENDGNALTYPVLTITGPGTNPSVINATTGQVISFIYTLAAGETLVVDTLNRTVLLNGTTNKFGAVDFGNTSWWGLIPGVNDVRLAFFDYQAGASLRVDYRYAWL